MAVMPAWFVAGAPVDCVYARSPDAEYILDSDWGSDRGVDIRSIQWRECSVPVSEFELSAVDLRDHLSKIAIGANTVESEMARCDGIVQWIEAAGGMDRAFLESPILARIQHGKLMIEDGYHRLGLARFTYGAPIVRVICTFIS